MSTRAVVYARKSLKDDRSEEQSASVEDQRARCRGYAEERGWKVVAEHWDDGRSGLLDRSKRKGLDALLRMVAADEVDVVVTLWTSRLSRDERQRAEILDDFDLGGVEWHAVADGGRVDRSTYSGYVNYGINALMDNAYSKRVGENWRRAHERRLAAGLPKTTSKRFGYRYDGTYAVHAAEAEVVKELYRRYTRGDGFRPLVTWLNDAGWRVPTTGGEWTSRTLSRFLDSGFAAGYISREADLREAHQGAHERLITEEQWLAYRARRRHQATLGNKASGAGERWWLAGFVRCGRCGGSMFIDSYSRTDSSAICSTRRANPGRCEGTSMIRRYIEGAVGLWLGGHLPRLRALADGQQQATADTASAAFEDAVAARDKIVEGLVDLEESKALGDIQSIVYGKTKDRLNTRLREAERDVEEAAAAMHQPEAPDLDLLESADERGWNADERAALKGVLDRIEIGRGELTIYPVTGEPVRRTRAEMIARCGVSGCDRTTYTRGMCKSHVMRARNTGGDDLLTAMAEMVSHGEIVPEESIDCEMFDRIVRTRQPVDI